MTLMTFFLGSLLVALTPPLHGVFNQSSIRGSLRAGGGAWCGLCDYQQATESEMAPGSTYSVLLTGVGAPLSVIAFPFAEM